MEPGQEIHQDRAGERDRGYVDHDIARCRETEPVHRIGKLGDRRDIDITGQNKISPLAMRRDRDGEQEGIGWIWHSRALQPGMTLVGMSEDGFGDGTSGDRCHGLASSVTSSAECH